MQNSIDGHLRGRRPERGVWSQLPLTCGPTQTQWAAGYHNRRFGFILSAAPFHVKLPPPPPPPPPPLCSHLPASGAPRAVTQPRACELNARDRPLGLGASSVGVAGAGASGQASKINIWPSERRLSAQSVAKPPIVAAAAAANQMAPAGCSAVRPPSGRSRRRPRAAGHKGRPRAPNRPQKPTGSADATHSAGKLKPTQTTTTGAPLAAIIKTSHLIGRRQVGVDVVGFGGGARDRAIHLRSGRSGRGNESESHGQVARSAERTKFCRLTWPNRHNQKEPTQTKLDGNPIRTCPPTDGSSTLLAGELGAEVRTLIITDSYWKVFISHLCCCAASEQRRAQ